MENRNEGKKPRFLKKMKTDFKDKKLLFFIRTSLNGIVAALLLYQTLHKNYPHVFTCTVALILLSLPFLIERAFRISIPNTLKIILLLFIFATQIMGEVWEFYVTVPHWDKLMHIISGFFITAFGLSLVSLLNRDKQAVQKLSPFFAVLVAFCFSMTVGVLWEFFEFGNDRLLGYDMQKDTWVTAVTSVSLHPEGRNTPVTIDAESVTVNGETWPGYLDIGLIDTMRDLLVAAIGSLIFSIFGYIYSKKQSMEGLMRHFVLTRAEE